MDLRRGLSGGDIGGILMNNGENNLRRAEMK